MGGFKFIQGIFAVKNWHSFQFVSESLSLCWIQIFNTGQESSFSGSYRILK
jgi:hypothetical protein